MTHDTEPHQNGVADDPAALAAAPLTTETTPTAELYASYHRLPDFLDLARHYDPAGKFRNAYTARTLGR